MSTTTIHPKRAVRLLSGAIAGSMLGVSAAAVQAQEGGSAADTRVLEEVIVTAQRREERIQSVPIAITAFDNNSLRQLNITDPADLNGRVPGMMVSNGGQMRSANVIAIRGQGQNVGASAGVVNYFAEVPLIQGTSVPTQGGPGTFFDLESMQILRGPQGTLFGRNTTGGAVLLGPKKPSDAFATSRRRAATTTTRNSKGAVGIPAHRGHAASASLVQGRAAGWIHRGRRPRTLRLQRRLPAHDLAALWRLCASGHPFGGLQRQGIR
ncbi:MAG: TonB-dependent receptor [Gammaproteobacteria bacterium]|nr:TonB-dependent receptor [Gammaproteobacteria bacterium]